VPYEDHEFFQTHSTVFVDFRSTGEQVATSRNALGDYLEELLEVKRNKPADDLLTRLAQLTEEGGEIDTRVTADMAACLLFAGHETTANMIALTVTLLQDRSGNV
jgi:cytochrome P450